MYDLIKHGHRLSWLSGLGETDWHAGQGNETITFTFNIAFVGFVVGVLKLVLVRLKLWLQQNSLMYWDNVWTFLLKDIICGADSFLL
jgi:hypothetical protein